MESSIKVRKVAQDVIKFVWFKHKIVFEEPILDFSFLQEIPPEFINNLCVAVWMQSFRIDTRWKGFLRNHFERMTSTVELYATYVSYACYTYLKESTPIYTVFFEALSITTYFARRCWEKEAEEFLNTSVELFSMFYEKELSRHFEENGSWKDFNEHLENNLDLTKYKSLIIDNVRPFEYFENPKDKHEKETKTFYALEFYLLTKVTRTEVESNEKAVSFGKEAAKKLEELCEKTLDDMWEDFAEVDKQIEEDCLKSEQTSEELASEPHPISPGIVQEISESIDGSPKEEEKEHSPQMEDNLKTSEIIVDSDKTGNQMEDNSKTSEIVDSDNPRNRMEDTHSEVVGEPSGGFEKEVEDLSSQNILEETHETISSSFKIEKKDLIRKIRKVTQDVLLFVWYKHEIIKEESLPDLSFIPENAPEFMNNLCISVWMQSFRNDFRWKGFLKRHFKRMTSSAELFAKYASYACYTMIENTTNAFAGFFDVLSLVTYFGLRCWEEGSEEYLNTSVDFVCVFFEKELFEKFENLGGWEDFNEYLEVNFDLVKYKSLIDDNVWPSEYFNSPQDERVEDSEISYSLQCIRHERVTETEVESNEKAVSFAESVADQFEELIQKSFEDVLSAFVTTDSEVGENYRETFVEASIYFTAEEDHESTQAVQHPEENISRCENNELNGEIRNITQNVMLFVWFKHKIIKKEPSACLSLDSKITPEFVKNLRIAVWMQSLRNDFKWKSFLKMHFKRMTSTVELFASYVYFASYTLMKDITNPHASFFDVLSLVNYFVLCCWEKGCEAFLNTSVELVCTFFEQELLEKFKNQGSWNDFNAYLETNFDLTKYKSLNDDNILPSQYLKHPEDKREEEINLSLALECINLEEITQSQVETNNKAVSLARSVVDKIEKLYQQEFDQVFTGITKTNNQVVEIYRQTISEAAEGVAKEVEHNSSENAEAPKVNLGEAKSEVKEMLKQMVASHSSDIQNIEVPTKATARLSPRSKKVRKLLNDIANDYSKLGAIILTLCDKHSYQSPLVMDAESTV